MKRLTIVVLCLALSSLACLQSAMMPPAPVVTMAPTFATQTAAPVSEILPSALPSATSAAERCAVVIASDALNLREGLSVHSQVLTWLDRGDVVHVVDLSNGDWWKVEYAGVTGFVRSIYLQERMCE